MSALDQELPSVARRTSGSNDHSYSLDEKPPLDNEKLAPVDDEQEERYATVDVSPVQLCIRSKPFPIDPDEVEETHQLTVRAIVVGCILGAVVGASNIYLGLKTGFTFGPQLFGAIFGYAILKPLSRMLPASGWFGGYFGPKENCTVQTAATAAGGLGILMVSAVPAIYRLNLLSEKPQQDFGRLVALTVASGFYGIFFVIPLRRQFIVRQKLTFPTPSATAYTIRALHNARTGAIAARKKSLGLIYSFASAFCLKVVSLYAPGVVWDWHIGWTLYRIGFTSIISLDNYGWWIEFTPAFFGAGQLSGMNASWSFLFGAVLAWGIIAPSLVATGRAVGLSVSADYPLVSYNAMSFSQDEVGSFVQNPSPRYWLLWPGVFMMLLYSAADVAMNAGPPMWAFFKDLRFTPSANPLSWFTIESDGEDEDDVPAEDKVPTWAWTGGLAIATIMSVALLATQFHLNVGEGILSLILAFLFSFIGVQSSGYTDVNPISTVAKVSQLVFGGIGKSQNISLGESQRLNLVAGTVAGGAAAQAVDMTGDLKTGYLLRAKPRNQFIAQLCGAVVAVFLTVGLFVLFTNATPCILHPPASGECTYGAPSVAAWAAVALAVSSPRLPIPSSSGYTAIALGLFSVASVLVQHLYIPRKYWHWIPNWNAVGLAFVVPQVYYPIAMAAGATFNYFWARRSPSTFDMYMFPVSAGMLAGEGLGGVFGALLAVAGVDGTVHGTAIGCPGFQFCG
ncbi:oligopeptide transporter [Vararia minispora EC-137]|uniref:Oligopeptide transporter n=1 Tax=Vararia minispora EC-137 TaxID=1314806 RepID=A0ACB8QSM1_9AGAM|nr:oligopeptide transporter [Vararia minispora EC-137]